MDIFNAKNMNEIASNYRQEVPTNEETLTMIDSLKKTIKDSADSGSYWLNFNLNTFTVEFLNKIDYDYLSNYFENLGFVVYRFNNILSISWQIKQEDL